MASEKLPPPPLEDAQSPRALLRMVLSWLLGCLLFVPTWAGLNFAFGTALDGPIGGIVMEAPCQRLARTHEPLHHYKLAGGKSRLSSSVCHFASGPVRVDGPTDGLGFTGRELVYLAIGFFGYTACFASALAVTVWLVRGAGRLLGSRAPRRALGTHTRPGALTSPAQPGALGSRTRPTTSPPPGSNSPP